VLRTLHTLIRDDGVDKRYLALISGKWKRRRQLVDVPLRKFVLKGGERMVRVDREGKPSRTEFRRIQTFAEGSLVEARLLTGRTHQIRVHAAHLGHPIAGDERYGRSADNGRWHSLGLRRMFLHAWQLDLPHPVSGERLHLKAPLSAELQALLDKLKQGL